MNEIVPLKAKCDELQWAFDTCRDEKAKLGVMYENLLKENESLKHKISFLEGQIEAYKYCVERR